MNYKQDAPNALVTHYVLNTTTLQATFNNLEETSDNPLTGTTPTGTDMLKFGDAGTDMVTLAVPTASTLARFDTYKSVPSTDSSVVEFFAGCGSTNNDAANLSLFKSLTGAHLVGSVEVSNPLTIVENATGDWSYYQITSYGTSACAGSGVSVVSNPAAASTLKAPGAVVAYTSPNLHLVQYATFRVKNGQLQQKNAPFNPTSTQTEAAEDAQFNALLDNVEDLQVAYIFNDGNIYNQSVADRLSAAGGGTGPSDDVPAQVGNGGAPTQFDATRVIGMRISLVGRSGQIPATIALTKGFQFRPASEDRAAGPADRFYHYRLTSTVLLRNRALGY
jgi:hypothetical protein